jgi:hypothetical protein
VLLYDLQLNLKVPEQERQGMKVTHSYYTQVDAFSVIGGLEKFIWKDGRGKTSGADVMAEFFQARRLSNITVQKLLNRETLIVNKIYRLKLPFEFTFVVQSLSHSTCFRSLQLDARDARIVEPPRRDSRCEALTIKFSDAKICYRHRRDKKTALSVVKEEI